MRSFSGWTCGLLLICCGAAASADEGATVRNDVDWNVLPVASVEWAADGPGGSPSFVKHVVPLFNKVGCSARECHGSFQGQGGFRLSLFGYDPKLDHGEITADEDKGSRIDVDHPDESLALRKPLGQLDHGGGEQLTAESWQYRLLRQWIADGAKYDPERAAYLDGLVVSPAVARLAPKEKVSLRVAAFFSDGTIEEVTPLTTFASNNDGVVQVDDAGMVTAMGHGDTEIVVSFAGGVVTVPMLVPYPSKQRFPEFPANNPVDAFVAEKLQSVGITPSGLSTDAEFLRRSYVDVIGTLPTADEVRRFLDDPRSDKRRRLVDELLNRPEYALYWATIFSDATGNNQQNINNFLKMSTIWHDWLRDKLGRNVPYDEMVGGIVTATSREGRSLEEYLEENEHVRKNLEPREGFDDGTYARRKTLDQYWLKRMPDRDKGLAIRTANAFLGVQIQCAECHKHPFDRWTQAEFEGFTSFFRTVTITDLDGSERSGTRYDYHLVALYPGADPRLRRQLDQNPPKLLAGDVVSYEDGVDTRVALFEWMRSPENPYFARNMANRLWAHYFGVGVVDPVDDLNAANPPSNPQLLDWLARDFIEHGFDLKHLHRRILNSRTYQLSHLPAGNNRTDKRNFSHALVKRMPAEVALDAVANVTGTTLRWSNYASRPNVPAIGLAASTRFGNSEYFLQTFGRPKREQTCACERSGESSLAQALFMINDADVQDRITDSEGRLEKLLAAIPDSETLVEELYLTCLSRPPTDEEALQVLSYIDESASRREAMQDVLWSLMNVREFLFVR